MKGLLFNANNGGENVHRGQMLGILLGLNDGVDSLQKQSNWIEDLKDSKKILEEVQAFSNLIAQNLSR